MISTDSMSRESCYGRSGADRSTLHADDQDDVSKLDLESDQLEPKLAYLFYANVYYAENYFAVC